MYVLIDKIQKAVVYRHEKVETLRALVNIELSHSKTSIFEETNIAAWAQFEVHNLQELFKSITGGLNPHSHNAEYLIGQLVRLCKTAPVAKVDAFEATVQSLQIKPQDKDFYRYVCGVSYAKRIEDPYRPPAILGDWKAAQALTLTSVATQAPAPAQAPAIAQPWAVAPNTTPPKYAPPWA